MAVMLAGSAIPQIAVSALPSGAIAATSDESEVAMQEALTKVKQRVTVPEELSKFEYRTTKINGTTGYKFMWSLPDDANEFRWLNVSIVGNIITEYIYENEDIYRSSEPTLAKLSDSEILEKGKAYLKQLNPTIADKVKYEISGIYLTGNMAQVDVKRYENGVLVNNNGGGIVIDKNTGELFNMEINWYENGTFKSPDGVKTNAEIKEAYRKLCKLTPYYAITTDWGKKKKTARIVYEPDSTKEIDAFTGEYSTIWSDMDAADGSTLDFVETYMTTYSNAEDALAGAGESDGGVTFTEAELEKIRQDNNLITADKAFEMLKQDKFAAVTDDYEIDRYTIGSQKDFYGKETFTLEMRLKVKNTVKDFKGYKEIDVKFNAETGDITYLSKSSYKGGKLPKLDRAAAKKIADSAAKTYAKSIIGEYKYNDGKSVSFRGNGDDEEYETSRSFIYSRYVNGIRVLDDNICVAVDSNGVVKAYSVYYTEDVTFPSADDILTPDQAFDKLYKQSDFNYYYDGWISKDGKVNTYLVYKIDSFYLNAKTGRLCTWLGKTTERYIEASEVKYSDIKGIPQENAILEMKKYGVLLTYDSKFAPNEYITEEEFTDFLKRALDKYVWLYSKNGEREDKANDVLTKETAAVIFTKMYDREDIAKLKGIFKTPYSDVKSSDENAGAIAIAYAKGFFGKGDGKFGGSKKITRAEAVQLVYDYIKLLSDKN